MKNPSNQKINDEIGVCEELSNWNIVKCKAVGSSFDLQSRFNIFFVSLCTRRTHSLLSFKSFGQRTSRGNLVFDRLFLSGEDLISPRI